MSNYGNVRRSAVYYMLGRYHGQPAIKIGITCSIPERLSNLHQYGVRLLAWHAGTGATETRLHSQFADAALGHEWFRPTVDLLCHIGRYCDGTPPPRRCYPVQSSDSAYL